MDARFIETIDRHGTTPAEDSRRCFKFCEQCIHELVQSVVVHERQAYVQIVRELWWDRGLEVTLWLQPILTTRDSNH